MFLFVNMDLGDFQQEFLLFLLHFPFIITNYLTIYMAKIISILF